MMMPRSGAAALLAVLLATVSFTVRRLCRWGLELDSGMYSDSAVITGVLIVSPLARGVTLG